MQQPQRGEGHCAAGRWVERTPRVVSTVTGDLTTGQLRWLAVLHAGRRSMLGGLSAAERHGLQGWERDEVTVLVDDELSFEPVDGVRFFRSRRPFDLLVSPKGGIPAARLEPSVLLWGAYTAQPRPAAGALAAAVRQRLTTASRLLEWVEQLRPLRRARLFRSALSDIDAGSQSVAELDLARLCRHFAIPLPHRQTSRRDRDGRQRWTDCEWNLPDGSTLVLEVDGGHHTEVRQWDADVKRTRRITARAAWSCAARHTSCVTSPTRSPSIS